MAILQEIKVPLLAVNDTELTIVELSFENGSKVSKGATVMVFETSKTTFTAEAEADGFIQYNCEIGKDYEVGRLVGVIYSDVAELELAVKENIVVKTFASHQAKLEEWQGETLFSAAATELMLARKIDKQLFNGRDFVNKTDVEAYLGIANRPDDPKEWNKPTRQTTTQPSLHNNQLVVVQMLSSSKKREISYLSEVQSTGLTSTIDTSIDAVGLLEGCSRGTKFLKGSLLPFVIYESARLLKKYPLLNAYFADNEIAVYKEVNIGFAVDIDKGLKVLKVPQDSTKTIDQIEEKILALSGAYLDDTLTISDLSDITFTITDLSGEGVSFFRPLINKHNSAILGISAIDEKLGRCIFSITFDHRVTEGKLVAIFLKELKDRLESYKLPESKLLVDQIKCFKCFKELKEDLSEVGFAKCVTPQGVEGYVCQSCLKGF